MYLPSSPSSVIDFIQYLTSYRIMGSQRVEHNSATKKQQQNNLKKFESRSAKASCEVIMISWILGLSFYLIRKEAQFWIPKMTVVETGLFMWACRNLLEPSSFSWLSGRVFTTPFHFKLLHHIAWAILPPVYIDFNYQHPTWGLAFIPYWRLLYLW